MLPHSLLARPLRERKFAMRRRIVTVVLQACRKLVTWALSSLVGENEERGVHVRCRSPCSQPLWYSGSWAWSCWCTCWRDAGCEGAVASGCLAAFVAGIACVTSPAARGGS